MITLWLTQKPNKAEEEKRKEEKRREKREKKRKEKVCRSVVCISSLWRDNSNEKFELKSV